MPIYEFECSHCGHNFDRLQKLSDADPTVCPSCHEAQLRRKVSAPYFRLAGSGWYETDFKKDGDNKRNLAGDDGGATARPATSETVAPATAVPAAVATPSPAAPPAVAPTVDSK